MDFIFLSKQIAHPHPLPATSPITQQTRTASEVSEGYALSHLILLNYAYRLWLQSSKKKRVC